MRVAHLPAPGHRRAQPLTLALALAFAPTLASAQTLPTMPSVAHGTASITSAKAGQLNVLQNTQNAVINWQSFSIGAKGQVVFQQPNAKSIALMA